MEVAFRNLLFLVDGVSPTNQEKFVYKRKGEGRGGVESKKKEAEEEMAVVVVVVIVVAAPAFPRPADK